MATTLKDRKAASGGTLTALTAAAMVLPAYQAQAANRDDQAKLSMRFSQYGEHRLEREKVQGNNRDRYDISVIQVSAAIPAFKRLQFKVNSQYEVMSGASPWWVQPSDPSNPGSSEPVQIMSGATIDDARGDLSVDTRYYGDAVEFGVSVGASKEKDYQSVNVGMDTRVDLPGKQTSLNFGVGASDDHLEPTDARTTTYASRVDEADKTSVNAVVGLTQIVSPTVIFKTAVSFTQHDGYLTDPYKMVWINQAVEQERRPDQRNMVAWSNQLRVRVVPLAASLHLDYRYFNDDWDIESHTAEIAWYQSLGETWSIAPRLRYYSQSQSFFYSPFYNARRSDGFHSSDYRLSPYGSINFGLGLTKRYGPNSIVISLDSYDSSGDYALQEVAVENPGLVDFTRLSVGMDFGL